MVTVASGVAVAVGSGGGTGDNTAVNGFTRHVGDYAHEPVRARDHLVVQGADPFNAETEPGKLVESHLTPTHAFYVRSHGTVPHCVDVAAFRLTVDVRDGLKADGDGDGDGAGIRHFSLHDLRTCFRQVRRESTMQCAGNRRTEMSETRPVKGVGWNQGVLGNAAWRGVRLRDVLLGAGLPRARRSSRNEGARGTNAGADGMRNGDDSDKCYAHGIGADTDADDADADADVLAGFHVEFEGADWVAEEPDNDARRETHHPRPPGYRASLSLPHVMSRGNGVLLAFDMNNAPLSADHGFPLRVVAPGIIGARSVKWLWRVTVRRDESPGEFMQRDYKLFSPAIDWHNINWDLAPPLMETNVQCAVCEPADKSIRVARAGADAQPTVVQLRGYAVGGGSRRIIRVDVSGDGGGTWHPTEFVLPDDSGGAGTGADRASRQRPFVWQLWRGAVPVQPPCEIIARAVDEGANTQPERCGSIWNLRGVMNNAWYRIRVLPATDKADAAMTGGRDEAMRARI